MSSLLATVFLAVIFGFGVMFDEVTLIAMVMGFDDDVILLLSSGCCRDL